MSTNTSVPRALKQKVVRFKRDLEETLQLNSSAAPEGWTLDGSSRIYKNLAWSLGSLGSTNSDFTNLFRMYRLKGARMKFYFSNTESDSVGNNRSNSQLMVRMAPNQRGEPEALDQSYWQQIQAKKYKLALNGGRPLDIYMPLKQRNSTESSTGTTYTMQTPKWIANDITNVAHHGINVAIDRLDGQGFSNGASNYQYVKIITTIYFECRGVE